jgi:hypothetical protein
MRRSITLCHKGLVLVACVCYLRTGGYSIGDGIPFILTSRISMALGITPVIWAVQFILERVHKRLYVCTGHPDQWITNRVGEHV